MKKMIAVLAIIVCVAGSSSAFARGYNHGSHGGYHERYQSKPYYYEKKSRHHNDSLGIAVGIVGGLLLGSALVNAATPPPPRVVYGPPSPSYHSEVVVVQPSRICVEERMIDGEWQTSRYDGRQVWVSFPYAEIRRIEVPCY